MQLQNLSLSVACLVSTSKYSQPSYYCFPVEALPSDNICRRMFRGQTSIMVVSPKQSKCYRRDIPNSQEEIKKAITMSTQQIISQLGLLIYPDYCSNKMLTLLCFFYFPTYVQVQQRNRTPSKTRIPLPSAVRRNHGSRPRECSRRVRSFWGPFCNGCNCTYSSDETGANEPV